MDLRAEKRTLKKLLGQEDEQFRIPPFQRPYSWTFDEVDDLWSDLLENSTTGHFMGSLVLATESDSRPLVIDGQQRLTTLMLILAVLRDACLERGMTEDATKLQTRFVADQFASGDDHFKFKTSPVNWPTFRDMVLREVTDPARLTTEGIAALADTIRSRNKPLIQNFERLKAHLSSSLEGLPHTEERTWLKTFTKNLMERVELVVIEVKDLADAFLLFETLNDRGLQLSAADLLKSHLLGQFAKVTNNDEEVDEAATRWDSMLEELGMNVDVNRFLRHYLLGYLQNVKKDEVFGRFKTLISQRGPAWVLEELRTVARLYGDFENPSRVTQEPTRLALEDLKVLRATSCYIALLPARRYLSPDAFLEFARVCETLTFRYSTVAGLATNVLEGRYRDVAQMLIQSQGTALAGARDLLIKTMPPSAAFKLAFEEMRLGTQYTLRYTLQRMEAHLDQGKEKSIKPNHIVHIEHIMPQTLTAAWKESLGEEGCAQHNSYLNRYGNLTLFHYADNIPASNKVFGEKKEYYARSDVALTKELTHHDSWGLDEIDRRQRKLADLADIVWPVPSVSQETTGTDPLATFRETLQDLWGHVEPLCEEVPADAVAGWAAEIPEHLKAHATSTQARALAKRMSALVDRWSTYDLRQREVLAGAVRYFLLVEDQIDDRLGRGLDDDQRVLEAAEAALS